MQGKLIYEKYGFRQVGETARIDCKSFGEDVVFPLANMEWKPENLEKGVDPESKVAEVQAEAMEEEAEQKLELAG